VDEAHWYFPQVKVAFNASSSPNGWSVKPHEPATNTKRINFIAIII
jgi:hypothetical protein